MGAKKNIVAVGDCQDCGSQCEYRQYASGPKMGQLYRWCLSCGCDQRGGMWQQKWADEVARLQTEATGTPMKKEQPERVTETEKPEPAKQEHGFLGLFF